jgi:hypothetical protein
MEELNDTAMMVLDLALTDVFASWMETGITFENDTEQALFSAHLREAYLLGQKDMIEKIRPRLVYYIETVQRALED